MPITITPETKNNLSISNEGKVGTDPTWDEAEFTWDEAGASTWDNVSLVMTKEDKNSLSISNESKN